MSKNNLSAGMLLTLGKLFFSIGPSLLKLAKTAKFAKLGLAGASMAAYSYMFTWEFAAVLLLAIVFHEFGHLNAMRRFRIKTKGIYLIPFFGGAAVASEEFGSRKIESYVALMGPVYGLFLAIVTGIAFFYTNIPLLAGLASFMALINIFNLLPIYPLDGGRILKSVSFSLNPKFGLSITLGGLFLALFMLVYFKIWLLSIILVIGGIELWLDIKSFKDQMKIVESYKYNTRLLETELENTHTPIEKSELANKIEENNLVLSALHSEYPHIFIPPMNMGEIIKHSLSYLSLILAFIAIIYSSSTIEGADIALQIIQDKQ